MAIIGACKLCLRTGVELRESHFLPKSAYKAVQKLGGVTPLNVRDGIIVQKHDQITAFLLCAACEDRFNKNGESWVMNYCNRSENGFRLFDLLQPLTPVVDGPDLKMFATDSIAEISAAKLAYFLLSILWRGSVHKWKWGKDDIETASLGKKYEEEFRRYLLGETDLPRNVAIHIFILANSTLWDGVTIPFCQKLKSGVWRYTFVFLGISFRCLLGNALNEIDRSGCVYRSQQKCVFLGPKVDAVLIRDFRPTLLKSRQLGKIRR